jgi:hypothetical protein
MSFSTLQSLGLGEKDLQSSNTIIRGFDGTRRDAIGEIELSLGVGPSTTTASFQVMHIPSAYNLLLGRPWIHALGGVPSSLHQSIKFVANRQLVTIHAEGEAVRYDAPSIPFIASDLPSSYQTLEFVTNI